MLLDCSDIIKYIHFEITPNEATYTLIKKESIQVNLQTITPIWTGGADGKCTELKPSAIIGALRFWFEVFCLSSDILVKENENVDPKQFKKKLKEKTEFYICQNKEVDLAKLSDELLTEMGISLPARVFGCTGWRSQVEIRKVTGTKREIKQQELQCQFKGISTQFWTNSTLFGNKKSDNSSQNTSIFLFKKISFDLLVSSRIYQEYLKNFFSFYQDKQIIIGGKKSFGFGFCKLQTNDNNQLKSFIKKEFPKLINKELNITISSSANQTNLGFNLKYFLRKQIEQDKIKRKTYFGEQGKTSKIFCSNIINSKSHIIMLAENQKDETYLNEIIKSSEE